MTTKDKVLLANLVFGVAKLLQDGHDKKYSDWELLHEDLDRAAKLAEKELNRLAEISILES